MTSINELERLELVSEAFHKALSFFVDCMEVLRAASDEGLPVEKERAALDQFFKEGYDEALRLGEEAADYEDLLYEDKVDFRQEEIIWLANEINRAIPLLNLVMDSEVLWPACHEALLGWGRGLLALIDSGAVDLARSLRQARELHALSALGFPGFADANPRFN